MTNEQNYREALEKIASVRNDSPYGIEYWAEKMVRTAKEALENELFEPEPQEKWNENVETCSDCEIQWKKIGKSCPVCLAPAEGRKVTCYYKCELGKCKTSTCSSVCACKTPTGASYTADVADYCGALLPDGRWNCGNLKPCKVHAPKCEWSKDCPTSCPYYSMPDHPKPTEPQEKNPADVLVGFNPLGQQEPQEKCEQCKACQGKGYIVL